VLTSCAPKDTLEKAAPPADHPVGQLDAQDPNLKPVAGRVKVTEEDLDGGVNGLEIASPVMVRQVQSWLHALHFNAGAADGRLGRRTAEAVRQYQKQRGLPVDGKITEALRDRLRSEVAVRPAP
jgi:hypothetical protein